MKRPSVVVNVVFRAALGANRFDGQTLDLGSPFPKITIRNIDDQVGNHDFVIAKRAPDQSDRIIKSVVEEAKAQIEHFWSLLAYIRGSPIRGASSIYVEVDGHSRAYQKPTSSAASGGATGTAAAGWFDERKHLFHRKYNFDLLLRLNFARSIADPVSRFVSLYSVLSAALGDRQHKIDLAIQGVEPSVQRTPSPWKATDTETLFTRLRNELAHDRASASVFETHREIAIHVDRFEWIVSEVLGPFIEQGPN